MTTTKISTDTSQPRHLLARLSLLAACGGLLGACYGVEFDERIEDVYYCQSSDECLEDQACKEFRCVDDIGPALQLNLPEVLTTLNNTDELQVAFTPRDFVLSNSDERIDGQGMVVVAIDGQEVAVITDEPAALITLTDFDPGGHQVSVQAVHGDGTPYENPSAFAFTTFFLRDTNGLKPQLAVLQPSYGHVHVLGEDLTIEIATRNFGLTASPEAPCHWNAECDPFGDEAATCVATCDDGTNTPPTNEGHVHAYLLPNYPDCLFEGLLGCNGDYVLTAIPPEGPTVTRFETTIPADKILRDAPEPGTYTLTLSLQYSDHLSFPNKEAVIFEQVQVEMIEK
ncbi:hypothetical protein G6O69_15265 [Pseudenhygromyxa sp. WMMC2535]|uniref:hypothetical protein n=1 Tax=Pseudenhygromyxa sp. WMMC2535 TaxID=2712867 RepID=UPI001552028F|nr:hypothetical protein [Pseudenhygromyxa sp. WMMC2535]NVB39201.1 hypothetical protein [Pseudenhygromyxa sp. WMMC2535]